MNTQKTLPIVLALAALLAAGDPARADDRDMDRRIDRLLTELGDENLAVRTDARAELLALGESARLRLLRASGSLDRDLALEAGDILDEMDGKPFDVEAFLDSVWMPAWIRPSFEEIFREAIEQVELPRPVPARKVPAPQPGRSVEHRYAVQDSTVNGERTILMARDGTEYTFRLHRDGSIDGEVESGRTNRSFSHSSRAELRRCDPGLSRVLDELTSARPDPVADVHAQVDEIFERAHASMPSDFDSEFRRIEREARRGLGR